MTVTGRRSTFWSKARDFFTICVKCIVAMAILGVTHWGAYMIGAYTNPRIVEVHTQENLPVVLSKISQAESLTSHYCTEKLINAKMCYRSELGQVLMNANKNGTVDIGKYQINTFYWGRQATEMGLDLANEQDNEAMALWIYDNYGTEPWYSSSNKWK